MADRYIAKTRGFCYPVGASVEIVKRAGGISKLPVAEREALVRKTVVVGEDCSDMPAEALAYYVGRGDVVRVESPAPVVEDEE